MFCVSRLHGGGGVGDGGGDDVVEGGDGVGGGVCKVPNIIRTF